MTISACKLIGVTFVSVTLACLAAATSAVAGPRPQNEGQKPVVRQDSVQPGDFLKIRVADTFPNQPIDGIYQVEPSGKVPLGYSYGRVQVKGLTIEKAEAAIREALEKLIVKPAILVTYAPVDLSKGSGRKLALEERLRALEAEVKALRALVEELRKKK